MMRRVEAKLHAIVARAAEHAVETFTANVAPFTMAPDAPPVLPALDSADYTGPSYYAVRRAMFRSWVNRRIETFTFVDADTVRRRMSVDFTLPATTALQPGELALVPLMLLDKQDLRNLDVRTEAGDALPVLTYDQNGTAAVRGLKEVLGRLVANLPAGHADRVVDEEALKAIVYASRSDGDVAEPHLVAGGALHRQLQYADAGYGPRIESLIRELERSFMLLVPLSYWPGQRLIVKFSYDAAIVPQPETLSERIYTRSNRSLSAFGLAGRVETFSNLAVGLCESYHAEAVPPGDAYIAEAALDVRRPGAPVPDAAIRDDDRHRFRPHLRAKPKNRGDLGVLTLVIHAHRAQSLLPLALASVLITVVLGFVPSRTGRIDGQTLAAVLLVPFALAAYYVRTPENSYVTRMLRGVRATALVPVLSAVLVIALVALGTVPPQKGEVLSDETLTALRVPFLASGSATIVLLLAVVSPIFGWCWRGALRPLQDLRRKRALARFLEPPPAPSGFRIAMKIVTALLLIAGAALLISKIGPSIGDGISSVVSDLSNLLTTWWDDAKPTPG